MRINKMKAPDAVLSFYNEVYALIYLFAIIPFYRLNNCVAYGFML